MECGEAAKGSAIGAWCAWPNDNANCNASANSAQQVPDRFLVRNQRKQVTIHFAGQERHYARTVMSQTQLVALIVSRSAVTN